MRTSSESIGRNRTRVRVARAVWRAHCRAEGLCPECGQAAGGRYRCAQCRADVLRSRHEAIES